MKQFMMFLLFGSWFVGLTPLTAQISVRHGEGDGNVIFYRDRGFRGAAMIENEGVRNFKGTPVGNDQVSSVFVPAGFQVTLYSDAGFRGESLVLYNSERDLGQTSMGGNRVSSAEVRWIGNAPQPVMVFSNPGYRGNSERFFQSVDNFDGSYVGNDRISSVRVPAGVTVELYEHAHFRGRSVVLRGDAPNLARTGLGVNEASSMRIDYPGLSHKIRGFAAVTLYDDFGFSGRRESLEVDDDDLRDNRIGNDRVRSIRVPRGLTVTLYEHVGYGGRSETLQGSDDDLSDNRIGLDQVSSIRIHGQALPEQQIEVEERPGVRIYEHARYRGRSDLLYGDVADLAATDVGTGRISSVEVPRGFRVVLFDQTNYRGRSEVIEHDETNLDGGRVGNDRARSLRIERADTPISRHHNGKGNRNRDRDRGQGRKNRREGVILYSRPNYQGDHKVIYDDVINLDRHPFGNDRLFSIKVPQGCRVTLYRDSDFNGRSEVFEGSDPALADNRIGAGQASSIRVEWLDDEPRGRRTRH